MSLINDMLRNLEAKRPDDLARQNLSREIRSLPPPGKAGRGLRWILLAALPALGVVAALLHADGRWLSGGAAPQNPPLANPPKALASAPVVRNDSPGARRGAAPGVEPGVDSVAPHVAAAVSAQAPVLSVEVFNASVPEKLRLADGLTVTPLPAAPVLPVPDPVASSAAPPSPVSASDAAPARARPENAGPVRIEKDPVAQTTPRERAEAEFRKAETALASGRSGEALESLQAALKRDPGYVPARQALLRQLLDAGRSAEAMGALRDGLELQPAQTGWAMSLARLQLEQGNLADADRTLARAQPYAEANADLAGFQGHVKTRLGNPRLAVDHYRRASRLAPAEGRWWLGLGLALTADDRVSEGKEAFRRALASGKLSAELAGIAEQHLHD